MLNRTEANNEPTVKNRDLIVLLNEDLIRAYQAVASCMAYSRLARAAQYRNSADELVRFVFQSAKNVALITGQIELLGGKPVSRSKHSRSSAEATEMFQFDRNATTERITHCRQRIRQCEGLGSYSVAVVVRSILAQESRHQLAMTNGKRLDIENLRSSITADPGEVATGCCDRERASVSVSKPLNGTRSKRGVLDISDNRFKGSTIRKGRGLLRRVKRTHVSKQNSGKSHASLRLEFA